MARFRGERDDDFLGKETLMRAEELSAQFGIAGILDFEETEAGLAKAAISLDGMAGELYLQGAQLTAWQLSQRRRCQSP